MYIGEEGVPYVHRGGGTLCTWVFTPPRGTFCLFSVLWYTFRGSKNIYFAMAQTV